VEAIIGELTIDVGVEKTKLRTLSASPVDHFRPQLTYDELEVRLLAADERHVGGVIAVVDGV
jgi:hypothetical protein